MKRRSNGTLLALTALALVAGAFWAAAADEPAKPLGPNVVSLKELEKDYNPVPFEHQAHAKMAEMWNGCTTCHHRAPLATTQPAAALPQHKSQEDAGAVPACKSCHEAAGGRPDIRMPNLKGAYHRQCLNCHREWAAGNNCGMCHKPKGEAPAPNAAPTPDDIIARMHPPIPEPEAKVYKARFTPADGGNVLFRHKLHTVVYGLKCVSCHYRENCSQCHSDGKTGPRPLQPGKTWNESHTPCMGCHQQSRCGNCHYKDEQSPPKQFEHIDTFQVLDTDHDRIACGQCHPDPRDRRQSSCGSAACHKEGPVSYPQRRPGPVATTRPALMPKRGDRP